MIILKERSKTTIERLPNSKKMKCAFAVLLSVLVLSHQYNCFTDEDLAEALWSDSSSMSEMGDICKFLLRNGNSDIGSTTREFRMQFFFPNPAISPSHFTDPKTVERMNINVYKSLYALLAYINQPLLEEALMKRMEFRCRQQLQKELLLQDQETVYKRSENEKVVGKKVKFHSWGGKRTGEDDIIPNPVYRAKFHSWGGKRSVAA